ncbi:alpha/beta fold hydrolase [Noviherbaspirillum sedimenti]|uniref:Alpha/beta hydrolase n=1 Tax=Noviherbaspirillum sedimenti TaxID=2320865 RepID=A0A3A3G0R4_9BURK|nr:alpha/beta hydrolase [Noviherbaspirillum sedimenti]RJG01225.1 alpha/beta hydrolase [Noviherbaspirillum sedimenti]
MTQPQIKSVQCISPAGLHKMVYKEWGDPANPKVLVCVHGVTRVSDDFDNIAAALCDQYRVICPDIVGRGRSDWLRNPAYYVIPQYVCDMVTLLARLDVETVDWIGTSMGGLIAIPLAALPGNPIRKLVLNDVGPALDMTSLKTIADYIGQDLRFPTYEDAETYIRAISVPFGSHTDAEWHRLAKGVLRQRDDGQWTRHYDLGLADPFKHAYFADVVASEALLWQQYDAITCPTLLLRGAQSGLMRAATADAMRQRGPRAKVAEFEGVGHAPTLMHEDQISIVKDFLRD